MLTETMVERALRDCYDPVIPLNIVDLGLIESIAVMPDPDAPGSGIPGVPPRFSVSIILKPTSTDEGACAQLTAQVENRMAAFEQVSRTSIELHGEPAWTPQRITPDGRRLLGLDKAASPFPILNNRLH